MLTAEFEVRLKRAMRDARVTQEELSKRLDVSRAAVGHWASGARVPDAEMIGSIAQALGVDADWLESGAVPAESGPGATWVFPEPIAGQRDFGNANIWTVPADLKTEVREAGQNIRDAHDGKSKAVVMRWRVIELRGTEVESFKQAAGWADLEPHIEAASKAKGKLARQLQGGLDRLRKSPDRLLLLCIDDFGTTGLTGDEVGSGPFAALVRNNLDSDKQNNTSAGGAFGLGKAAHWRCSSTSTVFFNTVTADHRARVIARSELTYHKRRTAEHAGPGWFGQSTGKLARSIHDENLARRLYLNREPLPDELQSWVSTDHGTSILVVGFQDPSSEEPEDPSALVGELERDIALNFWPAIRRERMAAIVEHVVGGHVRERRIVDPTRYLPSHCTIYDKFLANDTVETFANEGDVVCVSVPIRLPKCKHEREDVLKHPQVDAEAKLLVGLADPEDVAEGRGQSPAEVERRKAQRSLVNTVAELRGPLMVTRYAAKEGILVGARPFFAILLAGDAGGVDVNNKYVEQFLRAAEPPAHDRWAFTDDLREMYEKGARTQLDRFVGASLNEALRKVLRVQSHKDSDGPAELVKLLAIKGAAPGSIRESVAVLRNVQPKFIGDRWSIKADVLLKPHEKPVCVTPYVAMNVESGRPLRVRWSAMELVPVQGVTLDGSRFTADSAVTRFSFRGTTEASDVPVDPARCTARIALELEVP